MPPCRAKAHIGEGPGEGRERGAPAHGLGGEEFEPVEAERPGAHHFARHRHARQAR